MVAVAVRVVPVLRRVVRVQVFPHRLFAVALARAVARQHLAKADGALVVRRGLIVVYVLVVVL